ncbi:hypothetical protein BJX96DRAFT_188203 [Aspergillus floccosus]
MASFVGWSLNGDMPKYQELQDPDNTLNADGPETGFLLCNDWNWTSAGPFPGGPSSGPFDAGSPVTTVSSPNHPDIALPIRGREHHGRHGGQAVSGETETTRADSSSMFVPTDDDSSFVFSSAATSFSDNSHASPMHNLSPAFPEHASFPQYDQLQGAHDTSLPSFNNTTSGTMSSITSVHAMPSVHDANALNTPSAEFNETDSVFRFELDALDSTHLQCEMSSGEKDSSEASEYAVGSDDDEYYIGEEDEDADGEEVDEDEEQREGVIPAAILNGRPQFVPNMAIFENPVANGLDTNTCFNDIEEVHRYLRAQHTCPPDNTLPRTQVQKQAIVNEMVKLMKTTEFALDNENMLKPFKQGKHSRERMEAACWQLLETMIDRSLNGALLCAFNGFRRPREKYATFADRMSYVFECLGLHKTICKRLMDPPYMYTLVDDPIAADKRVRSNKNLNARKGTLIVAGKEAQQQQQPESEDEDPGPKKQPSKSKTRTSQATASRTRAAAPQSRTTRARSRTAKASKSKTATATTSNAQVSGTSAPPIYPQQNAFPVAPSTPSSMDGHVGVTTQMNGYVAQQTPTGNIESYPGANGYHGPQGNVPFHAFQPMLPSGHSPSTMHMQIGQTPAFHHQAPMGVEAVMAPHIPFTGPSYGPAPLHGAPPFSHHQGSVRRMTEPIPFPNDHPPYLHNHSAHYLSHSSSDNRYGAQLPIVPNMAFSHTQFGGVATPVTPFAQPHISPAMQNGQKRSSPDAHSGRSGSPKRRR